VGVALPFRTTSACSAAATPMTRPRHNPLLARPPVARHRLLAQYRKWWEERAGRALTDDLYEGVHTTTWLPLAAVYAQQAAQAEIGAGPTGGLGPDQPYPVVLALDVRGLEPLPDVDSLAVDRSIFRVGMMRDVVGRALEQGFTVDRLLQDLGDERPGSRPGPAQAHLVSIWFGRQAHRSTVRAIWRAKRHLGARAVRSAWLAWARTGTVPDEVLPWVHDQFRYRLDLGPERLVGIGATRPFFPYVHKDDSEVDRRWTREREHEGWTVFVPADLEHRWTGERWVTRPVEARMLWRNPRHARLDARDPHRIQLHGTSSSTVRRAFPDVPLPAVAPFPVRRGDP